MSQTQNRTCFRPSPSCFSLLHNREQWSSPLGRQEEGQTRSAKSMQLLATLGSATSFRGWHTGELKRGRCNAGKVSALQCHCTINPFRRHGGEDTMFFQALRLGVIPACWLLEGSGPTQSKQTFHMHWHISYLGHQVFCPHTPCMWKRGAGRWLQRTSPRRWWSPDTQQLRCLHPQTRWQSGFWGWHHTFPRWPTAFLNKATSSCKRAENM